MALNISDRYYFKHNVGGLERLLWSIEFLEASGENLDIDNERFIRTLAGMVSTAFKSRYAAHVLRQFIMLEGGFEGIMRRKPYYYSMNVAARFFSEHVVATFRDQFPLERIKNKEAVRILMVLYRANISQLKRLINVTGKKLEKTKLLTERVKRSKSSILHSGRLLKHHLDRFKKTTLLTDKFMRGQLKCTLHKVLNTYTPNEIVSKNYKDFIHVHHQLDESTVDSDNE
ncbi:uncharacterized protein LOC100678769 [Nasonia vitripennis]|uniref:Uncharacterized protein n=1 Tax=Nasonia vitripennis TaxID=7425 RepID=A0A7M7GMY4_NASVI|nr:uncharacterized protein LOC100678769 [Nasonia vitripennis]